MSGYRSPGASSPARPRAPRPTGPVLFWVGPFAVTPMRAVVILAVVGSSAFIAWAILKVRDATQIGAVIELWRAAARARMGRAVGMAVGGGIFGLAAIGCFTATVIFALLWKST